MNVTNNTLMEYAIKKCVGISRIALKITCAARVVPPDKGQILQVCLKFCSLWKTAIFVIGVSNSIVYHIYHVSNNVCYRTDSCVAWSLWSCEGSHMGPHRQILGKSVGRSNCSRLADIRLEDRDCCQ